MRLLINNIVKGYSASITVYLDLKHCKLKQCNGSTAFVTKSCKDNRGGVGLSFHGSAFDIEKMSTQVLVGLQAIGSRHLALPKQGQLALRLSGPCAGQTREPPSAWAAPLPGADPNATWRLGLGKMPDWLWQPQHHMPFGKTWVPPGAWAALMRGVDTSVTWHLGLGKKPD